MSLKNLRFKSRMFLLVGVFLLVLIGTHVMYGVMLSIVRVNGPLYRAPVSQGNDVLADLVPTNNNDSYVTVLHLLDEANPAVRQEFHPAFGKAGGGLRGWPPTPTWTSTSTRARLKRRLWSSATRPARDSYRVVR